jgi:hypothetical protein
LPFSSLFLSYPASTFSDGDVRKKKLQVMILWLHRDGFGYIQIIESTSSEKDFRELLLIVTLHNFLRQQASMLLFPGVTKKDFPTLMLARS